MSGCTLRFTRDSPLRTTLVDEATGHVKYKIETPIRITRSVTRIKKFDSPPQPPLRRDQDADSDSSGSLTDKRSNEDNKGKGEEGGETEEELPEASDEIARIYWKWFSTDRIVFRGRITTRGEFLPKVGKMKGRAVSYRIVGKRAQSVSNTRSYMFTGPDGVQYRWALGAMGMNYPKLVTTDEKKTVIAEFHRAHYFTKKQKARLEVQPAGVVMLDYIILTFVFAENKRKEREARAKSM